MVKDLKMTVLVDNIAALPLKEEWGLSILIEADGQRILLDTGQSGIFAQNAQELGIDLRGVDAGVLSHAHYDHSDGMDVFFDLNGKAPFYVREGSSENCIGKNDDGSYKYIGIRRGVLEKYADRIRYVSGTEAIADGIWLVPHRKADYTPISIRNELFVCRDGKYCPDDFAHEQSLVIETAAGLAVFNSCSHAGMANILADVREALGRGDVYAYAGGLHLFMYSDDELEKLYQEIASCGINRIYTGHCTGDHGFAFLHERMGDGIMQFESGFRADLT